MIDHDRGAMVSASNVKAKVNVMDTMDVSVISAGTAGATAATDAISVTARQA